MKPRPNLRDISIRTDLRPGDLGHIIHCHGEIYQKEYGYGVSFEAYVAAGIAEFYQTFDSRLDRVWICEHDDRIVGFLFLVHRENRAAQLRYFLLEPKYRGMGLGKKLMDLFMDFYRQCGYQSAYLWTTHEQGPAAHLYIRYGFRLTDEKKSTAFGKPLTEQRYDLTQ